MSKPGIFATIPVAQLEQDSANNALNRSLGPGALTALGGTLTAELTSWPVCEAANDFCAGS